MISINVHAHDRDKYLIKLLESLKRQTYKDFEINICETGNLNSTLQIAKQYSTFFLINYYCLHLKIVDRTKILNFLVRNSNGDVVCISDTDVIKDVSYLEEIKNRLTDKNFLVQLVKYLDKKATETIFAEKELLFKSINSTKFELNIGAKSQIAIKKEIFLALGGYDERIFGWGYEDSDLFGRLERYGIKHEFQESFGIHLFHEPCRVFKRQTFDKINLNIYKDNLHKTVIMNNVNRQKNQWDASILEPRKIL